MSFRTQRRGSLPDISGVMYFSGYFSGSARRVTTIGRVLLAFHLLMPSVALAGNPLKKRSIRSADTDLKLNHVNLIVNGERTAVAAGSELGVFKGDHLFIIQAHVEHEAVRPLAMPVDIEGFMTKPSPESPAVDMPDDRGVDIRVADLREGSYRVTTRYRGQPVGHFDLLVAQPRFDHAVVRINDRAVTIRQGERVEVGPEDTVKFESVRSNIQDATKIEVRSPGHGIIRFRYQGRTFGEIRLPVKARRDKKLSGKQGH